MNKPYIIFFTALFFTLFSCSSDDDSQQEESPEGLSDEVIAELLANHNTYRSDVGISDLTWSDELEESAQAWADQLGENCQFGHSGGEFGENIWFGTAGAFEPSEVVNAWGSEIADYNYEDNTCTEGKDCGHYTQIVWANTTEVGCGTVTCNGLDIWVCQYNPPGNFIGEKPY